MSDRYNRNDLYEFLLSFKREHGGATPTLRDICDALGVASISTAHNMLEDLALSGRINIVSDRGSKLQVSIKGEIWGIEGVDVKRIQCQPR